MTVFPELVGLAQFGWRWLLSALCVEPGLLARRGSPGFIHPWGGWKGFFALATGPPRGREQRLGGLSELTLGAAASLPPCGDWGSWAGTLAF